MEVFLTCPSPSEGWKPFEKPCMVFSFTMRSRYGEANFNLGTGKMALWYSIGCTSLRTWVEISQPVWLSVVVVPTVEWEMKTDPWKIVEPASLACPVVNWSKMKDRNQYPELSSDLRTCAMVHVYPQIYIYIFMHIYCKHNDFSKK